AGAEAVIDVTIPAAHHAVTADALHAGYPVLGEKPCAATLAEAVSLAGHAETTGTLFMISQSRRNNPHLHEARRLAEELGGAGIVDTRFAKAPRFGGFRDEMAHPLLVDMAIHAFDAGRVLLAGLPVSVTATSYNPGWSWYAGDAAATAVITYDSGAVHTYSGSWCSPGDETSWNGDWALSCERGTVRWDGESPPTAHLPGREPVLGRTPEADDRWELDASLANFCAALRGGPVPVTEVHASVWTQVIVEAAVRSTESGSTVLLAALLDEALDQARTLDSADGRSAALTTWKTSATGLGAGSGHIWERTGARGAAGGGGPRRPRARTSPDSPASPSRPSSTCSPAPAPSPRARAHVSRRRSPSSATIRTPELAPCARGAAGSSV